MAETALQMMQIGQQHSLAILNQVDNAMTRSLEIQSREGQLTLDMHQKALQFAEEKRYNTARIQGIENENAIRAQQVALEMQAAPLKFQTAQLQLQAAKYSFEKQKYATDETIFNNITQDYDDIMGSKFLKTKNPDQLRAYLQVKNKYRDKTVSGEQFNRQSFEKELKKIDDQFVDAKPIEGYSDETAFLFEKVSPAARKEYERRNNPTVVKSRNGLAVGYITGGDEYKAKFSQQFSDLYQGDELGYLGAASDIFQKNTDRIEFNNREASKTRLAAAAAKDLDDGTYENLLTQASVIEKETSSLMSTNRNIIENAGKGIFNFTEQEAEKKPENEARKGPNLAEPVKPAGKILNVPPGTDETSSRFYQRLDSVAKVFNPEDSTKQDTELANVDLNWFYDQSKENGPDVGTLNSIKTRVENQIEALEESGSTIDERFNKATGDKLFETIDRETAIPVSGYLAKLVDKHVPGNIKRGLFGYVESIKDDLSFKTDPLYDLVNNRQKFFTFGKGIRTDAVDKADGVGDVAEFTDRATGKAAGINSYESINKLLSYIPDPRDRKEAKKELYSSLIAASLSNAIKDR